MAHQRLLSPLFLQAKYLLLPKPLGEREHPKVVWSSSFSLRTSWFLLFTSEPRGLLFLWLPGLGLNPSAHLPLQPHFRLLLQSVTPASIPVFFQLYWAAIVCLGRCGPMVWSQSSPSSHTGAITRGSCFPVTSWVEVTPIPLAQSGLQQFNTSMKPFKG